MVLEVRDMADSFQHPHVGLVASDTGTKTNAATRRIEAKKRQKVRAAEARAAAAVAEARAAPQTRAGQAFYWSPQREMESTFRSAANILSAVDWAGEPLVVMFCGGSTIHVGLYEDPLEGFVECTALSATTDFSEITETVSEYISEYVKRFEADTHNPQVRMLLAGSPTYVMFKKDSNEYYTDNTLKMTLYGHDADRKLGIAQDVGADEKPTYPDDTMLEKAGRPEDEGGLKSAERHGNPGLEILEALARALKTCADAGIHCTIVSGNRKNAGYYCTDSTYAAGHLPPMLKPLRLTNADLIILSSTKVKKLLQKDKDGLSALLGADWTSKWLLVTSGHTETGREVKTDEVNEHLNEL